MHVVVAPVLDGAPPFELSTVVEMFGAGRAASMGIPWYDLRICAGEPGRVRLGDWAVLDTPYGLEALSEADTVLVPPAGDDRRDFPPALLDALRRAHARGARIASICTGAFVLAAAGLLDGRPAITHWSSLGELARRHPAVEVQPAVLYVDDGDVLTSAGSAAGLDLCLHLIRLDHGSRVAATAARWSVVPPHRDGGQAQFVPAPVEEPSPTPFGTWLDWARARLDEPIEVRDWARAAGTSPRTFARHFRDATGETPLQWLAAERVRRAQELLEGTDLPVDAVAGRCGFATAAGLRRHFGRRMGTTPQQYRRSWRGHDDDGGRVAS
jgi:AraC family transcriptional regulator, transcriptional activator FtrA